MEVSNPFQNYLKFSLCIVIWVIGFLVTYHASVLTIDDAFISFRYSMRLADGNGFSWNIGEPPIEGFSNLLWVLLLVPFEIMEVNLPTSAFWLSGLFLNLTAILIFWEVSRNTKLVFGFISALAIFTSDAVLLSFFSGLETSLYAFLVALSLVLNARYRISEQPFLRTLQVFIPCFLAITRFEGFALALIIVFVSILTSPREFRRKYVVNFLLLFGFVTGIFILRYFVFREFTPLPTQAKASGLSQILNLEIIAFLKVVYPFGVAYLSEFFTSSITLYMLLPLFALIFSLVLSSHLEANPVWIYSISLAFMLAVVLLNGGDWMPGYRLITPALGILLLSIPHSLATFKNLNVVNRFYIVLSVLIIINAAYWWDTTNVLRNPNFNKDLPHHWDDIGIYLDDIMTQNDLALMGQIGRIGYYGGGVRIIDFQGLVNTTVAKEGGVSSVYGKRMDEYNLQRNPHVIQINNPITAQKIANFYRNSTLDTYYLIEQPYWLEHKTYVFLRQDITERESFRLPSEDARLALLDEIEGILARVYN